MWCFEVFGLDSDNDCLVLNIHIWNNQWQKCLVSYWCNNFMFLFFYRYFVFVKRMSFVDIHSLKSFISGVLLHDSPNNYLCVLPYILHIIKYDCNCMKFSYTFCYNALLGWQLTAHNNVLFNPTVGIYHFLKALSRLQLNNLCLMLLHLLVLRMLRFLLV